MSTSSEISGNRCSSLPVLYTRGTHYEVGLDIVMKGRTFRANIESYLCRNEHLNSTLVSKYQSAKVRFVYESVLKLLTDTFPQYVKEIQGVADGARVPFFKLFLLHIDDIISAVCAKEPSAGLLGSTSICCESDSKVVLGHTQDGGPEALNLCYLVCAHIQEARPLPGKVQCAEERFAALCLPGMLPGLYMGYNHHGLVFAANTVNVAHKHHNKSSAHRTPRHFLCRALLSCSNMFEATELIQDEGRGIADGISITMTFCQQEGTPLFHNIEASPPLEPLRSWQLAESQMSVLTLSSGESLIHCNKFLRLKIAERDHLPLWSSNHRHSVVNMLPRLESMSNVVAVLGDQTDLVYSFFRDGHGGRDQAKTLVVGIFDLVKRTWSLYTNNPKTSLPVVVLSLSLK